MMLSARGSIRLVLIYLFGLLAGCGVSATPSSSAPPAAQSVVVPLTDSTDAATAGPGEAASPPEATSSASTIELKAMNWEETQKLIESHRGKIVVMDVWSTACIPCMREFPGLVALDKQHRKDGVACISLSLDYDGIKDKPPESYRERVMMFLTKQQATFDNVLSTVASEELLDKLELASMPAVYVYGRDGKLVKRFDNESITQESEEFTYKDVTKLVEELLAK
jgi:thiol-disulfide isomerase/thioredoxin